jgi:hypothetical protein
MLIWIELTLLGMAFRQTPNDPKRVLRPHNPPKKSEDIERVSLRIEEEETETFLNDETLESIIYPVLENKNE